MDRYPYILGCLLGTALGDAVGLRREGLSPRRAARMYGTGPLSPNLVWGRGLCSDDTEHTQMVGRALALASGDPEAFEKELARQLRTWLLLLPAGTGLATLRACLKLLAGLGPQRSGVYSAGNGPAMRSALIGVWASSEEQTRTLVHRNSRITHIDPRAEEGALVIALAAGQRVHTGTIEPQAFLTEATDWLAGEELRQTIAAAVEALQGGLTPREFVESQGWSRGVSGYVNQTVPAALYCWARWPHDFRRCVEEAVLLGGDADSVGAVAGAVCGANLGSGQLPQDWLERLSEWPRNVAWVEHLAQALAQNYRGETTEVPSMRWFGTLPRNVLFALIVLTIGFRRLLPPY